MCFDMGSLGAIIDHTHGFTCLGSGLGAYEGP